jgi:hypothetical protein
VIIEVTIAPGKTGVLGIHKDDDPRQLASNFAKIYNLSVESEDMLFNIILENMMSDAFKSIKNSDIAPILEAKEQEEQTSGQINPNSNGSYGGHYNDNSKSSYRTNTSKSKIQTTNFNTQRLKQFEHEYNEESMNSFNKNNEDMFEKSGYDE